ncbi:MAG: RNA polymerase sigma factor [candidate division Zixibacteria bacterium]|nr:RNA polymerase sigma factor [candidate division Zixibacteria bacterium]
MNNNSSEFWSALEPEYRKAMLFCRKLTGNRERGDDLFQDSMVQAFSHFESLRNRKAFRSWLYRIMINRFNSKMRRPLWKRLVPFHPDLHSDLVVEDPVDMLAAKRLLKFAFQAISSDQQVLVTLHELEGWPINELASLLNKTEGAVKASLFRARNKMKKAIEQQQKKQSRQVSESKSKKVRASDAVSRSQ